MNEECRDRRMNDTMRTFISLLSVIVAAVGVTFGIVKSRDAELISQVQDHAVKNETRIELNTEQIQELQRGQDVIQNELKHISQAQEELKQSQDAVRDALQKLIVTIKEYSGR